VTERVEARVFVGIPGRTLELWIEPNALVFRLAPGRQLEVTCTGPETGHLEVERHPEGHIAVYGWSGARFQLRENGRLLFAEPEGGAEFPTIPGGTLREMVEALMGPFEARRQLSGVPPPFYEPPMAPN
jgi:hypothetical protein